MLSHNYWRKLICLSMNVSKTLSVLKFFLPISGVKLSELFVCENRTVFHTKIFNQYLSLELMFQSSLLTFLKPRLICSNQAFGWKRERERTGDKQFYPQQRHSGQAFIYHTNTPRKMWHFFFLLVDNLFVTFKETDIWQHCRHVCGTMEIPLSSDLRLSQKGGCNLLKHLLMKTI